MLPAKTNLATGLAFSRGFQGPWNTSHLKVPLQPARPFKTRILRGRHAGAPGSPPASSAQALVSPPGLRPRGSGCVTPPSGGNTGLGRSAWSCGLDPGVACFPTPTPAFKVGEGASKWSLWLSLVPWPHVFLEGSLAL